MARSLFDASKALGATPAVETSETKSLTVAQAVNLIRTTLETKMPSPLKIVGEVSNFKSNNHWYFSLKDAEAVLHCVAWSTAARKFAFMPADGQQVLATGHISHYGPQGRTQLYVSDLQPVGAGALEMKFRALCDELRGLGYFDEARKKPLPILPRRIAVITSATGAAVQDVINTAAHRCKAVGLIVVDVRVQGEGAAAEVAKAIRWVDAKRDRLHVDAILVTRGGGSIEDLWAFNERVVADAVFKCSLPVVAAIGHESDTTIIELVADVRASTPTQAAMRLIPSAQELCAQIDHLTHRLGAMIARTLVRERERFTRYSSDLRRIAAWRVTHARAKLERLAVGLHRLQPARIAADRRAQLTLQTERLHRGIIQRVNQRDRLLATQTRLQRITVDHFRRLHERLNTAQVHLGAIDPLGVLRRGFSLTTRQDGTLIRSVEQVAANELMMTRVADGTIESVVNAQGDHARGFHQKTRPKGSRTSADQLDLFAGDHSSR